MRKRLRLVFVALGCVLVACGSGGTDSGATSPQVAMLDNRFSPVELTVTAGASVEFVGAGRNPHNAVAADGSWSTEDDFGSLEQFEGDSAIVVFSEPGTYEFFCTFHGNAEGKGMAGTLTVVDEEAAR